MKESKKQVISDSKVSQLLPMPKKKKGIFRIGTSGIVVPGSKETFPAEFQSKSRLNYYSSLFNTLEVNASFHKLPMASTFAKWALDVPADFQFTIKLWKEITHIKKLKIDLANIEVFLKAADSLSDNKGCLLVQFPGSITLDYYNEVEQILLKIQETDYKNVWRKAIEFRSVSWYAGETNELLDSIDASMVLHDIPKSKKLDANDKSEFIYFRFHGTKGDYRGSYSDEFLQQQADKINSCLNEGKDVYVYFNNTMGSAFENALSLKKMLEI